ncbi:MAG: oligosaccharide flippase family protein [Candidatus Acidiferrales bacterium]
MVIPLAERSNSVPDPRLAAPSAEPRDSRILAKGAGVSLTGGMVAQVLSIFFQVLIARLLGAAEFGLYAVGWTLVRLLPPVNTLGLESGVTYFGARYLRSNGARFRGVVRESITFAVLSGIVIGVALYLAAPALAHHLFHKPRTSLVIRAFAPAFPLYGLLIVSGAVTRLTHRMQYVFFSGVTLTGSALVIFCFSYMLGFGLNGAIFSMVAGVALGAALSSCFARSLFPAAFASGIRSEWVGRELMSYSFPLVFSGLAGSTLAFADRLFVASFCSAAELGVYQAASQIALVFSLAHGGFDNIFAPMVADLHARAQKARLAELYRVCTKWRLYSIIPILLVILFARSELVQVVYGSPYAEASIPLLVLALGKGFTTGAEAGGPMLLMTGHQKLYVMIPLALAPFDLLLNFLLVPSFGLVGAAAATAIIAVILGATIIVAVRNTAGIWPFDARYLKPAIAASATGGLLYLLRPLQFDIPAIKLLAVGFISVAAFYGCLIALRLDGEDREVLHMISRRLSFARDGANPVLDGE